MTEIGLYLFSSATMIAITIAASLAVSVLFAAMTLKITRWAFDRPAPEKGRGAGFWGLVITGTLLPFVVIPLSVLWILGMLLGGALQHIRGGAREIAPEPDALADAYDTPEQAPMALHDEALPDDIFDQDHRPPAPRNAPAAVFLEYTLGAFAALVILLAGFTAGLSPNGVMGLVIPSLFVVAPVFIVLLLRRVVPRRKPAMLTES